MPTNLDLDDELIETAQALGGFRTKKETVNAALSEFVEHRKRLKVIEAFGTFDFDQGYEYKQERRARGAKVDRAL